MDLDKPTDQEHTRINGWTQKTSQILYLEKVNWKSDCASYLEKPRYNQEHKILEMDVEMPNDQELTRIHSWTQKTSQILHTQKNLEMDLEMPNDQEHTNLYNNTKKSQILHTKKSLEMDLEMPNNQEQTRINQEHKKPLRSTQNRARQSEIMMRNNHTW